MNRKIWKVSLLVISLLVFQFCIVNSLLPNMSRNEGLPNQASVYAIQAPVDDVTAFMVNRSQPMESLEVAILEPGIYQLNLSFYVDIAPPGGVDLYAQFYQSVDWWMPGMGTYLETQQIFANTNWNNMMNDSTDYYETEVIAVRTGFIRLDFGISSPSAIDQVSANLTVDQILVFSTMLNANPLGENTTIEWTEDQTWQGFRINLPTDNYYNFSAYAGLDWDTTAGYLGGFINPVGVILIDLNYGQYMPYNSWNPGFILPAGPDTNSSINGPYTNQEVMKGGDYYLLGKSNDFTHLNSSLANFTLSISVIPTQILLPNQPLELQFNTTPNVLDTYVAVTIPEGHYFDAYFSNPSGANWTVWGEDAWLGSYTGPYFEEYRDPSTIYNESETLQHGWATTIGGGQPMPGLLGDMYSEIWEAQATYTVYINGTNVAAIPPGPFGINSWFNTFFFHVQAGPTSSIHSTTFNITANFEITPFPELTPSGLTFEFNSTVGPFYHIFAIPEASGVIYSASAIATNYTTTGAIRIEDMMQPNGYLDWEWISMFAPPLGKTDPPAGTGAAQNVNDTATLTYVAVRDRVNYIWVQGPGMIGGDMTECQINLEITPPIPYTLGTVATVTLYDLDLAAYTFNVVAGNTYILNLELHYDGNAAYGYFLDVHGNTPFVISSLFQFIIAASASMPFSMTYTGSFTARYSGRVTFVVMAESTVDFSLGEPPMSLTTIGIIIGVGIVMLVIGLLIGYFVSKRRRGF
jgi:hypothetical protein